MSAQGCGARRDYWPSEHRNGHFQPGGLYAPYLLNRYTQPAGADAHERRASIYWLVSTWNPYQVSLMHTVLEAPAPERR